MSSSPTLPNPPDPLLLRPRLGAVAVGLLAFSTYFCMYAFRKPFAVGQYHGDGLWGVDLKTTLVISQVVGYTFSKYLGVRWVSEASRRARLPFLLSLVAAAELALLLLPMLPPQAYWVALLLNGLPLGMVWGLVVRSLEGRRTSDVLLAVLSCSFIVASGVVKDIGRWLLSRGIDEAWMPSLAGALFLVPFAASAWLLDRVPDPDDADISARAARVPLSAAERRLLLRDLWPGLVPLAITYFFLTAFRDYRDNYGMDLFRALGYANDSAIFTATEVPIAALVLGSMAMLALVRRRQHALAGLFGVLAFGLLLLGLATIAFEQGVVSGQMWMLLIGLGGYLAYVPFGSFLFDHIMANASRAGTAVFAINLFDGLGYTGSVALQLSKDLLAGDESRLEFFKRVTYLMSVFGVVGVVLASWYFLRSARRAGVQCAVA